jgi:hypothetical protein
MILRQRGIGIFSSYAVAEIALNDLRGRGFAMDLVSVVGQDLDRQVDIAGAHVTNQMADISNSNADGNEAESGAKKGAVAGSTIGGVTGLLVGLGAIAIPGVGPVMLAGAAATAIASAISGSVIGAAAGSLAGGLVGLGIPEDRAQVYGDRVDAGDYLVMVEGSTADIDLAESIFSRHGIQHWDTYDLPGGSGQAATPVTTHYL